MEENLYDQPILHREAHLYFMTYLYRVICFQMARGDATATWAKYFGDKAVWKGPLGESEVRPDGTRYDRYDSSSKQTYFRVIDAAAALEIKSKLMPNPRLCSYLDFWEVAFRSLLQMETLHLPGDMEAVFGRLSRKMSRRGSKTGRESETGSTKSSKGSKSKGAGKSKAAKSKGKSSSVSGSKGNSTAGSNLSDSDASDIDLDQSQSVANASSLGAPGDETD